MVGRGGRRRDALSSCELRDGILAALHLKINNGRAEGLNNHVRLITRRAYGFHSAQAALALIMLTCGPIELHLPTNERPDDPHSCRESHNFPVRSCERAARLYPVQI